MEAIPFANSGNRATYEEQEKSGGIRIRLGKRACGQQYNEHHAARVSRIYALPILHFGHPPRHIGQMICMICMMYSHVTYLDLSGQLDRFLNYMIWFMLPRWEPCNLHCLEYVSWVGSVLFYRSLRNISLTAG